jgi:two-component system chemotaxis response regulator CheB
MTSSISAQPVVAILMAASTGGIRALSQIFRGLPEDFPAPIVVVLHRPAKHGSLLVRVLQRETRLNVQEARPGEPLQAGTIYVARSDLHLTVTSAGTFSYVDGERIKHVLSSANPLFMSSAAAFGERVIAVVLTGFGSDGADGVQSVKAHGGIVIAQDEQTSQAFGMPGAAIQTGAVDYVLPLEDIAPTLVRLVSERQQPQPLSA